MFLLVLHLQGASTAVSRELRGLIWSSAQELQSDFMVSLQSGPTKAFARGLLKAAPRYAEAPLALVARCLSTVQADALASDGDAYTSAALVIRDYRRGMRRVAKVEVPFVCTADDSPWRVAMLGCALRAFGSPEIPPLPPPLEPRLHFSEGKHFHRLSELPNNIQKALSWTLQRHHRLSVPGFADAITPEVVNDLLCNRTEVPRPVTGWLWP
jgi:hypothetical protein